MQRNAQIATPFLWFNRPVSSRQPLHLVLLALPKRVGELLERAPDELGLLPQVGRQEAVGVGDGDEGGLQGVLEGLGGASGRGVGVLDTGELEETLDGGRGNEAGTTGGGDQLRPEVSTMILEVMLGRYVRER